MSGQVAIGEAPDAGTIEAIARDAMARLPSAFRAHLGDVVLIVEEFADDETLAALGIEHPLDLTGLYHGRPMGEKSSMDSGGLPDRIHLYRRAILDEWVEGGERLDDLVTHVMIHEIGHHFGLSDDDMHALEEAMDESADDSAA
ncbi:metallopeptidase family protein [Sphingomonadaceae bacterium jetA1]|jgi:predicted Zn-dependent protease with MMP-like domain|uniref:metallopeptidase family protein n=1 Tax=Facivitalis istanbulensis TaxID=3075838 RepID=UPI00346EE4C5